MSTDIETYSSIKSTKEKVSEFFLHCSVCALWLPCREDSVSVDRGLCPKRLYPLNMTHAADGCRFGVVSVE